MTIRSTVTLSSQHETNHEICQVLCHTLRIYYTGLDVLCDFVVSDFHAIAATHTCLDHELQMMGQSFVHAHGQFSCVYLTSTFDVTHVIKCTRLSHYLAGRAQERELPHVKICILTIPHNSPLLVFQESSLDPYRIRCCSL